MKHNGQHVTRRCTDLAYGITHLPCAVTPGANAIKITREVLGLIQNKNIDIVMSRLEGRNDVCRCDVYRPKSN
jgi:hypothetical protein